MFSKNQFKLGFKTYTSEKSECVICYDEIEKNNIIQSNCNHIYCISCFKKYLSVKSETKSKLNCPYCRQMIDNISINNEEEKEKIIKEYCEINKKFSLFDPVSIYIYTDMYTIPIQGEIDLEGGNDFIVVYPIVVSFILFIYACFIISIEKDIVKQLIHFLITVLGIWYVLYSIVACFYELNIIECYLIGWVSLVTVGTIIIIY
jgi:hypothetical protein